MSQKTFNLNKKNDGDLKISLFAMISIAILAIFSLGNVLNNYVGLGLSATVAFAIAVIIFLVPFIFMIAEFASLQKGSKSGLTSWIHTAVGRKTAFITSFMFWFANLTYFFGAVPSYVNTLSFAVTGADYTNNEIYTLVIPFACVIVFAIITAISTLSTKKLSKIISFGGGVMLGLTGFFFFMAIIGWITGMIDPSIIDKYLPSTEAPGLIPNEDLNLWGDSGGVNFAWISTFIWVLMAADGGQSLGVYVKDVRGGKRKFVKAMIISVMIIGAFYILGTLLASVFPPEGGLAAGWANSFVNVFKFIFLPMGVSVELITQLTYVIIGLAFFMSSIGGLIIWTSAPVKVMFSEIAPGIFGSRLSKQNKNGVCSFGAWVQFFLVIPFLFLLTYPIQDGGFSENLALIRGAAGWIGMLPWFVIFASYINLRLNKDHEKRSFRMGNRKFGITMGVLLAAITVIILFLTFLDTTPLNKPFSEWQSNWWLGPFMKLTMIVLVLVPTYLWYYFKYEYQYRDTKIAIKNNLPTKYALVKYSFTNKFVLWLNPEIHHNYISKKNKLLFKAKNNFLNLIEKEKIQYQIKSGVSDKIEQALEDGNYLEVKMKLSKIDRNSSKKNEITNFQLKENKKALKNQISIAKKEYKIAIKNEAIKLRKETKHFYKNKFNSIIFDLKSSGKMNKIFLKELDTIQEKDIPFNNIDKKYDNYTQYSAASYYYALGETSIKLEDKIMMNNNEMIIVRNFAGSLTGEKFAIKNIKLFKESIDKDIKVIASGKWADMELISVIHVENNQFQDFKIYVSNANEFIENFNKNISAL